MVDVTPGDSGANKGFWRKQLRDRYGRFVEMGGSVLFELDLPGVSGTVHATGTFVGMLDLETARIEVPDDSRVPKGVYLVKSDKITAVEAKLPKSYVDKKLQEDQKSPIPSAELKQAITGEEAQKIRLKSVAKALKAEGRFPIPRQFTDSHVGKDSDTAKGAKLDYKKVFDSEPALQEKYGSAENLWTKVVEYAVDNRSQSPNTLAKIPEDMKEINRAYAKHVLGIEPDGLITFYRNAINGKDTPEESALGYASIDKTMAYDYNPQMGNAGTNGRYEIDVKPDELYGMIGYSKIEDEYGVVLGREMTNIPGRVRRIGDLEKVKTAPWLEKSADVFRENAGSSPFRYFTIMSQYEMHPVESFGADINEFFSKYNLSAADIKTKFDELYGEGSYDEYKASGNTVSFQNIKGLFIDLGDGKVGLDAVKLSRADTSHANAAEYKNDSYDNTMKMLSVFQELTGEYFMTHRTRDYTPPEKEDKGQTGIFKEYSPDNTSSAAEDTPLTDLGFDPEQEITVYRGVPEDAEGINPGDWVTTLPELAKDYAGGGKVISMKVKAKDLYTDPSSGEDAYTEEMVYRPK